MPRTLSQVDADLRAKANALQQPRTQRGEVKVEIDALLEERHRLRGPLRPSQVLGGQRVSR